MFYFITWGRREIYMDEDVDKALKEITPEEFLPSHSRKRSTVVGGEWDMCTYNSVAMRWTHKQSIKSPGFGWTSSTYKLLYSIYIYERIFSFFNVGKSIHFKTY